MLKRIFIFIICVVFPSLSILFFTENNFFFWDTVQLAAQHALWFYEHSLNTIFLPENLDSGHIPAFGYYLAIVWSVFGKNLVVSHWALLPFLLLLFFMVQKTAQFYAGEHKWGMLYLLIIAEPTLMAQLTLISPDVALVGFFLWHWWAIEQQKYKQRYFSSVFLVLISLRGSIVLFVLELYFFIRDKKECSVWLKKHLMPILPAIFVFLIYQYFHLKQAGWIAWHARSPWAESFAWTNLGESLYNSGIFIWRILDFGRWILFALILGFGLSYLRKKRQLQEHSKNLLLLLLLLIFVFFIVVVFHKSLLAHRYFIPIYIVSIVLVYTFIQNQKRYKNLFYALIFISLISGHLWIYKDSIAQGWDSSLAYYPYYELRQKALDSMKKLNIKQSEVGSDFPNLAIENEISLNGSTKKFHAFDVKSDSLIFYSNIFNNFTDEDLKELKTWNKVFELKKRGIKVVLYSK